MVKYLPDFSKCKEASSCGHFRKYSNCNLYGCLKIDEHCNDSIIESEIKK
jgi:hypothetical protein